MEKVDLVQSEWDNLMKLKREAPYKLMKGKSESLMMLHEGIWIETVARLVDRKPSTVETWIHDWHTYRQASIHAGHADNLNASKLTDRQRDRVVEPLSSPPSHEGIPEQFWSVPELSNWIYDEFNVEYSSASSYRFLLHMAGLTFHKPAPFDQRRADEDTINARMAQIRAQITPALDDDTQLVVAADEVRLEHEALVRHAWIPAGEKPHLEVDRQKQSTSFLGFLDQNSGTVSLKEMDWQNTDTVLEAVKSFVADNSNKKSRLCGTMPRGTVRRSFASIWVPGKSWSKSPWCICPRTRRIITPSSTSGMRRRTVSAIVNAPLSTTRATHSGHLSHRTLSRIDYHELLFYSGYRSWMRGRSPMRPTRI